jgi:3'-phosphoadenosine 5'-phosphosulfate (PAPS) 3'-phosphatase
VPDFTPFERELAAASEAARLAGEVVLDYYNRQAASVYAKADGSVVTDADLAADRIIRERIGAAFPDDPFLTEEEADDPVRLRSRRCWVVDPVDGTQQFVDRTGEFEVLIALVQDGRPVVAAVYQPTTDLLLTAVAGHGVWMSCDGQSEPLAFRPVLPEEPVRIMTSTWLGAPDNLPLVSSIARALGSDEAIVSNLGVSVRRFIPPDPLTDALIGVRVDDRQTYAWEWDFAAPDLIMFEAGGAVTDLRGAVHRYNKPNPANVGGIVLSADPATHARVLNELAVRLDGIRPAAG